MYPVILAIVSTLIGVAVFILLHRAIKRTFKEPLTWRKNNQELATAMVIEDITRSKERLLFFGGKGDTYSDDSILSALSEKTIPVEMIFENPDIGNTKLGKLAAKKPNMYLGCVAIREPNRSHFRVVDYDYVYVEQPHGPEVTDRYYKRCSKVRFLPAEYSKRFYGIKAESRPCLTSGR